MRVLIATDGSDFSCEAIKKGCRLINKNEDLTIKIISVYERVPIMGTEPFAISVDYINELSIAMKNEALDHVAKAVVLIKQTLPSNPIKFSTRIDSGIPEQLILETAQEWSADLIIMGSHGRGFWGRALIGSTSDAVIHHAPCPVLVIRKSEGVRVKSLPGNK